MANAKDKVAPGTPAHEDPEAIKASEEQVQVHEEATEKRTAGPYSDFDSVEDAEKDLAKKREALAEALQEAQAAEQSLPEIKIAIQQQEVNRLKEQGVQYDDQGRELGILGTPVSNPTMYGGNPAPNTLGLVH